MSQSSAQASAFYKDIALSGNVWSIRDKDGIPAPVGDSGKRSMPFWSSAKRAEKVINNVPAYQGFEVFNIELDVFLGRWLIGLEKDGLQVGVNWSGNKAIGYDVAPQNVKANIEHHLSNV